MDYNKVTLVGHVVHSPKVWKLEGGDIAVRFSLATNSASRDSRTMELKSRVDYHEIVAFGRVAEVARSYVKGGMHLLVEGRIQNREYVGKAGAKVRATDIAASQVILLSPKAPKDDSTNEVPSTEIAEPV